MEETDPSKLPLKERIAFLRKKSDAAQPAVSASEEDAGLPPAPAAPPAPPARRWGTGSAATASSTAGAAKHTPLASSTSFAVPSASASSTSGVASRWGGSVKSTTPASNNTSSPAAQKQPDTGTTRPSWAANRSSGTSSGAGATNSSSSSSNSGSGSTGTGVRSFGGAVPSSTSSSSPAAAKFGQWRGSSSATSASSAAVASVASTSSSSSAASADRGTAASTSSTTAARPKFGVALPGMKSDSSVVVRSDSTKSSGNNKSSSEPSSGTATATGAQASTVAAAPASGPAAAAAVPQVVVQYIPIPYLLPDRLVAPAGIMTGLQVIDGADAAEDAAAGARLWETGLRNAARVPDRPNVASTTTEPVAADVNSLCQTPSKGGHADAAAPAHLQAAAPTSAVLGPTASSPAAAAATSAQAYKADDVLTFTVHVRVGPAYMLGLRLVKLGPGPALVAGLHPDGQAQRLGVDTGDQLIQLAGDLVGPLSQQELRNRIGYLQTKGTGQTVALVFARARHEPASSDAEGAAEQPRLLELQAQPLHVADAPVDIVSIVAALSPSKDARTQRAPTAAAAPQPVGTAQSPARGMLSRATLAATPLLSPRIQLEVRAAEGDEAAVAKRLTMDS